MKYKFMWLSWTKGKVFQFGDFHFNGGRPYKTYRLGPLYLRIYEHP